jgi:hypothetical protein
VPACATIPATDSHLVGKYATFEVASLSIKHESYPQYLVRHEWQLHSCEGILKVTQPELFETLLDSSVRVKKVPITVLKKSLQTRSKMSECRRHLVAPTYLAGREEPVVEMGGSNIDKDRWSFSALLPSPSLSIHPGCLQPAVSERISSGVTVGGTEKGGTRRGGRGLGGALSPMGATGICISVI